MSSLSIFRLLPLLSILAFLILSPSKVLAQNATQSAIPLMAKNYNALHHTDYLLASLMHTTSCLSIGTSVNGAPCLTFLSNVNGTFSPYLSYSSSPGLLDITTVAITSLYTSPPIRTAQYLGSVGENLGIKHAHAQGVVGSGSGVIDLVFSLWQVSRNISYVFMIIIFVVIGLMVMFRQKINPQTVITAQTAIPGLVIGLVMITFSYFLAALLVDIAFLGTWLTGYYFQPITKISTESIVSNVVVDKNVLDVFSQFSNAPNADQFTEAVGPIIANIGGTARNVLNGALFFMGCQYGSQFADPVAKGIGAFGIASPGLQIAGGVVSLAGCVGSGTWATTNPDAAVGFFIFLVVIIILLLQMIKLLMKLINNYISILFLTFTAPFQFLFASLPGRQGIINKWIISMLCNVLAFPAVFAAFYFAAYILGPASNNSFGLGAGAPISGQALPLLGGFSQSFIRFLVGFGVLIATPAIPDLLCKALGAASQAGALIGQEISEARGKGQQQLGQVGGNIGRVGAGVGSAFEGTRLAKRIEFERQSGRSH